MKAKVNKRGNSDYNLKFSDIEFEGWYQSSSGWYLLFLEDCNCRLDVALAVNSTGDPDVTRVPSDHKWSNGDTRFRKANIQVTI